MANRHHHNGVRKICKCPRRRWPKCEQHPWHFNFRHKGEDYRFSLERRIGKIVRAKNGKWRRDPDTLGDPITTKTDATAESERLRALIRSGEFHESPKRSELTLAGLLNLYRERHIRIRRPASEQSFVSRIKGITGTAVSRADGQSVPLGDWLVTSILTDTLERFREVQYAQRRAVASVNGHLNVIRAAFNWGIRMGVVQETPFRRNGISAMRLDRGAKRDRRLHPLEATKLLRAATPHLRDVIMCALEAGMRKQEILTLQWWQVEGLSVDDGAIAWSARPELILPDTKTKTKTTRRIPISQLLKAILERRRFDPTGSPMGSDSFVFGNEVGERVRDISHAFWGAVLRAHGFTGPVWEGLGKLTPAAKAERKRINLHFHDLRREAGSRWSEGGISLLSVLKR